MKEKSFSPEKWLDDLRFSGDKKELVAHCVVPECFKVTVFFNSLSFNWNGADSKYFRLGARPGAEVVVNLKYVDSSVSRSMVVPGKQYVKMSSNSVFGTRKKMLNHIFAGTELQKELLPFVRFLRDGTLKESDEQLALEYIQGENDLSSLALGIFLLGMHQNGIKACGIIQSVVDELALRCSTLNLFDLSLLCLASSMNLVSGKNIFEELEISIKHQLDIFDTSENATFSLTQFTGLINLYKFSTESNIRLLSEQLINVSLKNLAVLCFDGVSFACDTDLSAKQIVSMYKGSAQSVISCFVPGVPLVYNPWTLFILLSDFEPNFDLVEEVFSMRDGLYNGIRVNKSTAYLLADVSHPKQGVFGMVALNKTCTVFSSYYDFYADELCDTTSLKAPEISIVDSLLKIIYTTDGLESQKTMLYWPQDEFEKQSIEGNWVFGEASQGRVAVYCSCPILEYNDVLINKELEAVGNDIVWSIICADTKEDCSLSEFSKRIKREWIL